MFRYMFVTIPLVCIVLVALFLESCCGPVCQIEKLSGTGGGQDAVTVHLPFAATYDTKCVQGAGGSYSHLYDSTRYDLDLDTPNSSDVPVYAPVGGVAFVHDTDRTRGFGVHVNIDMGDGTYVVLGHLDEVFIDDGSEVAAGQLLGYEGTTGASTGDHVHFGRHDGDAERDATYGDSVEGLEVMAYDVTSGEDASAISVTEFVCDLSSGHTYGSALATPLWHPNGTLIKTPSDSTVYLIDGETRRAFYDEDAFWTRGYDFADVALVDDDELACYPVGANIAGTNAISAVYDDGDVWLVFPEERERQYVHRTGWQSVLKSWGIMAATYDDLPTPGTAFNLDDYAVRGGYVPFREGSLVSEVSSSAVYIMSGDIAMPIASWDVYLLMGFEDRTVIEVDDGLVNGIMGRVGDCATNAYCITHEDVTTCGGPSDDTEVSYASSTLQLEWTTPDNLPADRITLSGEYTSGSTSSGWMWLAEASESSRVTYERSDAEPGDNLRFSVEYEQSGGTSWSCLAPFPPGVVQGSATAMWGGVALDVTPVDDPSSDGCGLLVQIPLS